MPIHNFCSWTSFFASKMSEMNLDIYWTVFVQQSVKFNSHHFLLTLNKIKRSDFPLEKACHIKKGKNKKKKKLSQFLGTLFSIFLHVTNIFAHNAINHVHIAAYIDEKGQSTWRLGNLKNTQNYDLMLVQK